MLRLSKVTQELVRLNQELTDQGWDDKGNQVAINIIVYNRSPEISDTLYVTMHGTVHIGCYTETAEAIIDFLTNLADSNLGDTIVHVMVRDNETWGLVNLLGDAWLGAPESGLNGLYWSLRDGIYNCTIATNRS